MWVEPWDGAIVVECLKIVFVWYHRVDSIVGSITCRVILHVLFHTIHHHILHHECNTVTAI